MPTSHSIGNHLNFLSLGVRAARSYAPVLPKEAMGVADEMDVMFGEITSLNAQQEKAKQTLARLTRELTAKKRESMRARARLIRLAEATFGPRDPRIKEFRPATEGKVRTARGPEGMRKSRGSTGEFAVETTPPAPPKVPAGMVPQGTLRDRETALHSPADALAGEQSPPRPGPVSASVEGVRSEGRPTLGPVGGAGKGDDPIRRAPRTERLYVSARSLAYCKYGMASGLPGGASPASRPLSQGMTASQATHVP